MRVVLDTNVLISAILSPVGAPARILRLTKTGRIELIFSLDTVAEHFRVLRYSKIEKLLRKRNISVSSVEIFLKNLVMGSIVVIGKVKMDIIKDDLSDNKFIECALAGQADFIISGDIHLLKLKKFRKIHILNPRDFLKKMKSS